MTLADALGLVGLIGLLGIIPLFKPVPRDRPGTAIRRLGILGLVGISNFWFPGLGATGAASALSLWNHQTASLRKIAWLGWVGVCGPLWIATTLLRAGAIQ